MAKGHFHGWSADRMLEGDRWACSWNSDRRAHGTGADAWPAGGKALRYIVTLVALLMIGAPSCP